MAGEAQPGSSGFIDQAEIELVKPVGKIRIFINKAVKRLSEPEAELKTKRLTAMIVNSAANTRTRQAKGAAHTDT